MIRYEQMDDHLRGLRWHRWWVGRLGVMMLSDDDGARPRPCPRWSLWAQNGRERCALRPISAAWWRWFLR